MLSVKHCMSKMKPLKSFFKASSVNFVDEDSDSQQLYTKPDHAHDFRKFQSSTKELFRR